VQSSSFMTDAGTPNDSTLKLEAGSSFLTDVSIENASPDGGAGIEVRGGEHHLLQSSVAVEEAGGAGSRYGINVVAGQIDVEATYVRAGAGTNSYAALVDNSALLTARDTHFVSGGASSNAAALLVVGGQAVIETSTLIAADATVCAAVTSDDAGVSVYSSLLWVGSSSGCTVDFLRSGSLILVGNTIVGGSGDTSSTACFFVRPADVANNIFTASAPSAYNRGIWEANVYTRPLSFQNNLFLGVAAPYYSDGNTYTTDTQVNGLNEQGERFAGNIVSALTVAELFSDPDGPDDDPATWEDNDWTLLSPSGPASAAGLDITVAQCGTYTGPHSCPGVPWDRTHTDRTVPWSIGAYESDP
jgi:hypothetical protein